MSGPHTVRLEEGGAIGLPYKLPSDGELTVKEARTEHAAAWHELGKMQFQLEFEHGRLPVLYGFLERQLAVHAKLHADHHGKWPRREMPRGLTILLVGPSQCGKDVAGDWFSRRTTLSWAKSMSAYGLPYFATAIAEERDLVYRNRHKIRTAFRFFMDGFRHCVPNYFLRLALNDGDVISGVRSHPEFVAGKIDNLFDLAIWIERPGLAADPTLEVDVTDCDMVIRNCGAMIEFYARLERLAETLDIMKAK